LRLRYAPLLLGIIALACAVQLSDAAVATARPSATVHRALVKLRNAPSASSAMMAPTGAVSPEWIDLASRTQVTIWTARRLVGGLHVIELAPRSAGELLEQSLERLRADPAVEYAEVDQRRHPVTVPDDPLYSATPGATGQWYLQAQISTPVASATPSAVDAQDAWTITTGSTGLVIADIDTGVRFDHPDLLRAGDPVSGRLLPGYDFVSDVTAGNESDGPNADASDPGDWVTQADTQTSEFSGCTVGDSSWHGTRVSGVLGALSNNDLGITGTTWLGWQLPVRALGKCGGNDSDIETAMLWAAGVPQSGFPVNPYPARILNMSLGGTASCSQSTCPQTSCPQSYQTIISELAQMGVLVVASAGNSGGPVATPGNCAGVVAVAGLREDGTKVGYSNLGTGVALSAPAGNCVNTSGACLYSIDTTYNVGLTTPEANSYTNQTNTNLGTSFAAPIVSGIAGLMLSVNANLTPAQLLARLQEGATTPFPVSSDTTVPMCHMPISDSDYSQDAECNCTTSTCGVGMANALGCSQCRIEADRGRGTARRRRERRSERHAQRNGQRGRLPCGAEFIFLGHHQRHRHDHLKRQLQHCDRAGAGERRDLVHRHPDRHRQYRQDRYRQCDRQRCERHDDRAIERRKRVLPDLDHASRTDIHHGRSERAEPAGGAGHAGLHCHRRPCRQQRSDLGGQRRGRGVIPRPEPSPRQVSIPHPPMFRATRR
jgi:serine protease